MGKSFPRFAAAYGVGHFGKSLFWSCGEGLFVFYLTEVCGLSPGGAGLVVGAALQFSAFADILLLRSCRGLLARPDGAPRLQAAGAALTALFFLLFALTAWIPAGYRLGAALLSSLAFRTAYAVFDVPQNALLGLAAATPRQRTRLASIRMAAGGLAGLCVSGLAYYLLSGIGAVATTLAATVIGLIAIAGSVSTMASAPRREGLDGGQPLVSWPRLVSPSAAWLLAAGTAGATASTVLSKLVPYFAAYGLGSASAGGLLLAAGALGGVLSQPAWLRLADRRARPGVIAASCLALIGASVLFYPASSIGLWAVLPCTACQGAAIGGLGTSIWAAMGDEACRNEDPSASAVLFTLLTFLSKTALAGAVLLLSLALTAHPYRLRQPAGEWPLLPVMCLGPVGLAILGLIAAKGLTAREEKSAL